MRVSSWGRLAARFAARHSQARVIAQFERSVHVEADGEVICLVAKALGDGPLNAVVEDVPQWPCVGATVGFVGASARHCVAHEQLRVDCTAAQDWRPPQPARVAPLPLRREALAMLQALANSQAPEDGLARPAFDVPAVATPVSRMARPRIERLRCWLLDPSAPPPTDLIGLGPGLTPSGDDLLCGLLMALHVSGSSSARHALAPGVLDAAPAMTSALSNAFLRAAAQGEGSEVLHRLINAIVEGTVGDMASLVAAVGRIGHTSGWDAMAGAALALAIDCERSPNQRSPNRPPNRHDTSV